MAELSVTITRSDGQTFGVNDGSGWLVADDSLEGFFALDISVNTSENVLTDGSSLVSKRLNEKDRTMSCIYVGNEGARAATTAAQAFFNPRYTFRAEVDYMGTARWVEGELYKFEGDMNNGHRLPRITFTLLCLDPYYNDSTRTDKPLDYANAGFGFPYVSHVRETLPNGEKYPVGTISGRLEYGSNGTIYNNGDVPTTYTVRMTFDGVLHNPTIKKDGKFVRILTATKSGDVIEIDFESTPPRVLMNGANAIQLADRSSNFTGMEMQTGANEFEFTCTDEENRGLATVQILFYKKWLGV